MPGDTTLRASMLLACACLLGAGTPAAASGKPDPLRGPFAGGTVLADRDDILTAQYYRDFRDRTNGRRWRDDDDDDGDRNRRLRRGRRQRDDDDDD